jgi:hypothetical protein
MKGPTTDKLHRTTDAVAYNEVIQQAVNTCLKREKLCIKTVADILNNI